jgi:hypothetical protein
MFNFHTVLMPADTLTRHKQLTVHERVIVPIELTTPRLTRLTETVANSLSGSHTTTEAQPVLALALIKRNEAHLPAPNTNYLLLVHP